MEVRPRLARTFLKEKTASSKQMNDTHLFAIAASNAEEKVGNISFFVEVAAFNHNHARYKRMTYASRRKSWRWRTCAYGFNLSVLSPDPSWQAYRHQRIGVCQFSYYYTQHFRLFKLPNSRYAKLIGPWRNSAAYSAEVPILSL